MGRNAQRRRAAKSAGRPGVATSAGGTAWLDFAAITAAFEAEQAEQAGREAGANCKAYRQQHVDGTAGECELEDRCAGGPHIGWYDCADDPDECDYCWELTCRSPAVEHRDGTVECEDEEGICFADAHCDVEQCWDAPERPRAYSCGPRCGAVAGRCRSVRVGAERPG
jgi:hypothetical protein